MRALLIGAKGMLAYDLRAELEHRGWEVVGVDLPEFDLTDPTSVAQVATGVFGPVRWVFNCAAYTAVDRAETDVDAAMAVNALGPGYLAAACQMAGVRLVHLSTDFVFDGIAAAPYTEDDVPNPQGVYGRSKREGEVAVLGACPSALVVRTAWLYGPMGKSFPRTMIQAWRSGKALRVVADQVGCPTYTADLAKTLVDLAERDASGGLWHASGEDVMTWHDLARHAIQAYAETHGLDPTMNLTPVTSAEYPTPAKRPAYSVLSGAKRHGAGLVPMRPTAEALRDFARRAGTIAP